MKRSLLLLLPLIGLVPSEVAAYTFAGTLVTQKTYNSNSVFRGAAYDSGGPIAMTSGSVVFFDSELNPIAAYGNGGPSDTKDGGAYDDTSLLYLDVHGTLSLILNYNGGTLRSGSIDSNYTGISRMLEIDGVRYVAALDNVEKRIDLWNWDVRDDWGNITLEAQGIVTLDPLPGQELTFSGLDAYLRSDMQSIEALSFVVCDASNGAIWDFAANGKYLRAYIFQSNNGTPTDVALFDAANGNIAVSYNAGFGGNITVESGFQLQGMDLPESSGFNYTATTGAGEVSISGEPNTTYRLRQTADLDFTQATTVHLTGVTVGTRDGDEFTTDATGQATVQFDLGTAPRMFFRAEMP